MAKKVIQVPIDEKLLDALDSVSKKRCRPRSEVIREACQQYLKRMECEELDTVYQEGYRRLPEEPTIGEAQVALASQILSKESW
jgi:metal-responsive CopG/Arc/MetJ family transcriptional regulator